MSPVLRRLADRALLGTRLAYLPVRVRKGVAAGAWWTIYPWTSYWRGKHEPAVQDAVLALGDLTGKACWDLGAHYGLYSVGLARRVGPTGEVAAFEPNPVSFRRLELHTRRNHLAWLKLFRAAASDRNGTDELLTYGTLDQTSTHLAYEGEIKSADSAPIEISTVRLDDLVAAGRIRTPHFVKVDIEGHAHKAFAGASETIRRSRPIVIAAFHSPAEKAGVEQVLNPLRYSVEPLPTAVAGDRKEWFGDYLCRPL